MKTTSQTVALQAIDLALLQKPLDEFFVRTSHPSNTVKSFNKLLFESLRQGLTFQTDELENLHALADLLLACSLLLPVAAEA
ncbi:hypothetical protein Q5H93_24085 [Hymenobacter sp. ASUV-10]|uniref:Uncharacterized protein n=1 Tax=Hymenobacter aranciens TaxID=3063996 RepID=A0ABT9BJI8_9BACT|nr:hypothetical protein [Hymenobacter sp. ASUV-10]MDO7877838.1 hypothetical protein [Hymenobacter sp. ASUV-10]